LVDAIGEEGELAIEKDEFDRALPAIGLLASVDTLDSLNLVDIRLVDLSSLSRFGGLRQLLISDWATPDLKMVAGLASLEVLILDETPLDAVQNRLVDLAPLIAQRPLGLTVYFYRTSILVWSCTTLPGI